MKTTLTRQYYKGKLYKITTYLIPLNKKPYQSYRGWKYVKLYEKLVNNKYVMINHALIYNYKY